MNTRAGRNRSFPSPAGAEVKATCGLAMPWLCQLPAELSYGVAGKAAAAFPLTVFFTETDSGSTL